MTESYIGPEQLPPKLSWSSPICEACWLTTTPYTVQIDAGILIKVPVRVLQREGELEVRVCGYCGAPTIWGVFVRVDPRTIPFPTHET